MPATTQLVIVNACMSERYWTAVLLDDECFEEEPRLPSDEETLDLCWNTDPIILKAEMEDTGTTRSPRAYALAALTMALYKIVEHHANILDWFKTSLNLHISVIREDPPNYVSPEDIQEWMSQFEDALERVTNTNSSLFLKLDHFLTEDVIFGTDALPRGALWRSVQDDPDALRSLLRIKQHRNHLRDIQSEFHQIILHARAERRNYYIDEQDTPPHTFL
ncbi:hypothetical protein CEP51_009234 [Fusarium floridanum]|uniref:Uncharacterized protein n=1 Tax=Fusarium floridanum TaxID=1325733 RepID=A0A428RIB6_9HYPO|nr:hypothetical protein CEP51_009234 [Fusarium floridanum]